MSRHNIGVAIALPQPVSDALQDCRERLGDPAAAAIVPHVTPTYVAQAALPQIRRHLQAVAEAGHPFRIHLRGSGTFRPVSPVVFVPLVAGISECEQLEQRVRSGPLQRTLRFPYHPHVTVAHDLPPATLDRAYSELSGYEAVFTTSGFTLFEQDRDGVWWRRREFAFPAGG
ncbi:MAG: 2'-5' RNA ligase family protein [Mycobacteriales bacterium]